MFSGVARLEHPLPSATEFPPLIFQSKPEKRSKPNRSQDETAGQQPTGLPEISRAIVDPRPVAGGVPPRVASLRDAPVIGDRSGGRRPPANFRDPAGVRIWPNSMKPRL